MSFTSSSKSDLIDKAMNLILIAASLCTVASIVMILFFIFKESLPLVTSEPIRNEAGLEKLFLPQGSYNDSNIKGFRWEPVSEKPGYSLIPLLVGTLKATIVALCLSVPFAIFSAIFVVEFAPAWLREIVKPCIELLANIPSVIIGFLGLMIIGTAIQYLFGFSFRLNAILAGFCLSFAVIPIIFTITEDSLSAVPFAYREASLALGADKIQTITKVVLPVALPGIFAGIVLGFGRALGETMIVLMCSGNTPLLSFDFSRPIRTMSATIASEMPEVSVGSAHYHVLFFIGALLVVFSFLTNLLGNIFVEKMNKRLNG